MSNAEQEEALASIDESLRPHVLAALEYYTKTTGGSWHISFIQSHAKKADGLHLNLVLCSDVECAMTNFVVDDSLSVLLLQ